VLAWHGLASGLVYLYTATACYWVPGLRMKTPSLLKLLGWSLIPVASFIMQSTYPVDLSRMEMPLKLIWCPIWSLCSATVNFSGWPRFMCHMFLTSDFNGSASLSNIDFATFTRHTVYTHNLCFTDFSIWLFFFTGMWMVFMLCLARSLLILFETICWNYHCYASMFRAIFWVILPCRKIFVRPLRCAESPPHPGE
jgi:hypothetical protein